MLKSMHAENSSTANRTRDCGRLGSVLQCLNFCYVPVVGKLGVLGTSHQSTESGAICHAFPRINGDCLRGHSIVCWRRLRDLFNHHLCYGRRSRRGRCLSSRDMRHWSLKWYEWLLNDAFRGGEVCYTVMAWGFDNNRAVDVGWGRFGPWMRTKTLWAPG